MTISVETFIVVSMMLAVFSAVVALGSSLVLGIGFERLRSGFEIVRKQTGYFSDAIFKLDERVESLEGDGAQSDAESDFVPEESPQTITVAAPLKAEKISLDWHDTEEVRIN